MTQNPPPQQQSQPQPQQPNQGPMIMGPNGPQYAAYPVGGGPQYMGMGFASPYPMNYYPGQPMYVQPYPYPYPYYGQPPMGGNTVFVIPQGYTTTENAGYSPWGNLAEDLDNLF